MDSEQLRAWINEQRARWGDAHYVAVSISDLAPLLAADARAARTIGLIDEWLSQCICATAGEPPADMPCSDFGCPDLRELRAALAGESDGQ